MNGFVRFANWSGFVGTGVAASVSSPVKNLFRRELFVLLLHIGDDSRFLHTEKRLIAAALWRPRVVVHYRTLEGSWSPATAPMAASPRPSAGSHE